MSSLYGNNKGGSDYVGYTNPSRPRTYASHTAPSASPRKESSVKGHDAVLKALQGDARKITVVLMSGVTVEGKVVGRDKFTITVMDDHGVRNVIYKHAIELFYGEERPKNAEAKDEAV